VMVVAGVLAYMNGGSFQMDSTFNFHFGAWSRSFLSVCFAQKTEAVFNMCAEILFFRKKRLRGSRDNGILVTVPGTLPETIPETLSTVLSST
jgi:hypothetical protein